MGLIMAKVVIQREWPDGDGLTVVVEVKTSYPDAVAEAKRAAIDTYRESLGLTLTGNESGES